MLSSNQLHKNKLHPDNPIVFFDVEMRQTPVGRIVMELFKHQVPKVFETKVFVSFSWSKTFLFHRRQRTFASFAQVSNFSLSYVCFLIICKKRRIYSWTASCSHRIQR